MELRLYQSKIASQIVDRLTRFKLAYLAAEVRCGKTLMALEACKLYQVNKVLFLTKKKAIGSIELDYKAMGYTFSLTVVNYESMHKLDDNDFDIVVCDESHTFSAFPKPSKRVKMLKQRFSLLPIIFLTGTPAIESGSQWYHQFFISEFSPFAEWTNFYKWSRDFVNVIERNFGYAKVKDYSDANRDKIQKYIEPYLITFTQKESGFTTIINENVLYCDIKTKAIAKRLIKDRVIEGKNDLIIADTPVKLQSKVHQILNGTCILESGKVHIFDNSKALFIKEHFKGKKLAIFYYFKGELEILKSVFDITINLNEFNNTDKHIALQQTSSEGMNLSKADIIVYYNFGFSGKDYVQSRDRLTTMERKTNDIYFIFGKGDMNEKIYERVKNKMNYNIKQFKKDYGVSS